MKQKSLLKLALVALAAGFCFSAQAVPMQAVLADAQVVADNDCCPKCKAPCPKPCPKPCPSCKQECPKPCPKCNQCKQCDKCNDKRCSSMSSEGMPARKGAAKAAVEGE